MNRRIVYIGSAFLGLLFIFLIYQGTRNRIDPLYVQVDSVFQQRIFTLDEKPEALDSAFYAIQKDKSFESKGIHAMDFIGKPFLPTMDYRKFLSFLDYFYKTKKVFLNGVTGSGNSTLSNRIANLVAADSSRILYLPCVEQMSVEYNKQYIGYYEGPRFVKGKLLDFFERCVKDSLHNYVFIVDAIDKIYPSTLFGAALWSELDNPEIVNAIEGYSSDIRIPSNFFLLSISHKGVGSTVELNAEHFRRLTHDGPFYIGPDYKELLLALKDDTIKRIRKSGRVSEKEKEERIRTIRNNEFTPEYQDSLRMVLFCFAKSNQLIEEKYSGSHMLGQWSPWRKVKGPVSLKRMQTLLIDHVNAFRPKTFLAGEDFKPMNYSINHGGKQADSYFFYTVFLEAKSYGFISEIGVATMVGIASALYGIYVFRKRKRFVSGILNSALQPLVMFRENKLVFTEAESRLVSQRKSVEECIRNNKIYYSEANFLLLTIGEQIQELYTVNQTRSSEDIREMIAEAMDDDILTEQEYNKFLKMLDRHRDAFSQETYDHILSTLHRAYLRNSPA